MTGLMTSSKRLACLAAMALALSTFGGAALAGPSLGNKRLGFGLGAAHQKGPAPKALRRNGKVGSETAANQLVRYLEKQGVTKVFGVPGEETLHLVDAIRKSKRVDFVLAATEQGASFMATGYARATGKVGVALSTLGPGATNLVTGASNALSEGIKVLFITGQAPVKRPMGYHQKMSLTQLFKPVTRLSLEPKQGQKVLPALQKLFATAHAKPGPVHLSLPADVAGHQVNSVPLARQALPQRKRPSKLSVGKVAKLLQAAKLPVIVAGDGVLWEKGDRTAQQVLAFAKAHNIPVVPSTIAKGMFPWKNGQVLPPLAANAKGPGGDVLRRADVIISVGYHPTETFDPAKFNPKNRAKVVQISADKLGRGQRIEGMKPTVEITSRLSTALRDIHRALGRHRAPQSVSKLTALVRNRHDQDLLAASKRVEAKAGQGLPPERVIAEVRRGLDGALGVDGKSATAKAKSKDGSMVFADIGVNKGMMTHWFRVDRGRELMINNGMSTMGIALPSAVGAKLANPRLKVVSVSGDGGFMMTAQELATAAQKKLPVVHVVLIDKHLGLIDNHQQRHGFKHSGVDLPASANLIKVAKGLGADAKLVKDPTKIAALVKKGLAGNKPLLIGVPVDYSRVHEKAAREGQKERKVQKQAQLQRHAVKTRAMGARSLRLHGSLRGLRQVKPRASRLGLKRR